MPAKHSIKQYIPKGYYHIYNRGVEKRRIFQDRQDYVVFLSYLKTYLLPVDRSAFLLQLADPKLNWDKKGPILHLLSLKNFAKEIQLLTYCLMPNHFHLLIKQKNVDSMNSFMRALLTKYTLYFNKKNKRVGHLFQGRYKAVLVETDEQLLYLTRYIHLNPSKLQSTRTVLVDWYSSYSDYLKLKNTPWINKNLILSFFSKTNPLLTYKNFVEDKSSPENELICKLILD